MRKATLLCVLILAYIGFASAGDVTFQANMKIKIKEGTFQPGSGDIVRVAGSFNNWGSSTDTLKDGNNDSIYTKTITIPDGAISYKFLKTLRGGLDWEGDPNRTYTVVAGAQTIPAEYFDRDSVFTPAVNVPVTFQVNMKIKMLEGTFLPGSGDVVRVAGSFNNWGSSTDTLNDANNDSIYTKTIQLLENTAISYKFLKTPRGGDWEGDPNRSYTVPIGGGTIPVVYFDRDSIYNAPVSANILWRVDMSAFATLGWFRTDLNDSIEVRGSFNGWGGSKMTRVVGQPGKYEVVLPYSGTVGDVLSHKYFLDLDSASGVARFPTYVHSGTGANRDDFAYDHPYTLGDGNRSLTILSGGNIQTDRPYFGDINPAGLLDANDSVNVTMKVNMGPAKRYVDPFVPGVDSLFLRFVGQTALWRDQLSRNLGSTFRADRFMTSAPGGGDSIYQVTFKVKGPLHYGLMYQYIYRAPGAGGREVNQGGGIGASYQFTTRYIQPLSPNTFPANYTTPTDLWKRVPLDHEIPPYTTDVQGEPELGVPKVYSLAQNYPNPFNPSTRIKYTLPEQARVTLRVFNTLGQEVATLVNEVQAAGNYVAMFEGKTLATGVYFYRLETENFTRVLKMILLK